MTKSAAQGASDHDLDAVDTEESGLRDRFFHLPPVLQWVTRLTALAFVLFHITTAWVGALPNFIHRGIHVGIALSLVYVLFGARRGGRPAWHDYLSIIVVIVICLNVIIDYERIVEIGTMGEPPLRDLILGAMLVVISLETGRRTIGPFLPMLGILFLLYAYFGPYIPGLLGHKGFSVKTLLEISYLTTRGMWGLVTAVIATVIAMFIIFGATIAASGAGNSLKGISLWVGGRMVGGGAYVAVIASSLFGTISGSTVSNVVATGSFTIPMMKGLGYNRSFAGAVEATASTGGQLMPPVMGAAAFIMAEYLGVPYRDVMLPALLPALLYYAGAFFAVRFYAQKHHLPPVPPEQVERTAVVFHPFRLLLLAVPLATLIHFLLAGIDTSRAVLYALLAAVITHLGLGPLRQLKERLVVLWHSMEGAAVALAVITPLALCAQIVVMVVGTTGIGIKLSETIISLSHGNLPLALGLAAIVAIVLGMGLPTPAAYVVAAAVLAPTLTGMGLTELSAHMFLFYFAVMSAITPPVCAAVYVAANVANAPWLTVARYAMALALPGLIVPFLFVSSPVFLAEGSTLEIARASLTGLFGVAVLAASTMGFLLRPTTAWERIALAIAALLLLEAGWLTDVIGVCVAGLAFFVQWTGLRAAADQATSGGKD
ncbi:MAG: TRAP transporter fused permease subunit [Rhodospirillales bacterium]|nr:TRAP transporter fused permease subunit [Rhodospirillales bacterium]